jgi:hypothetical protein
LGPGECDIDPGDQCGISRQRGLDLLEVGGLPGQRAVSLDQLGLKFTQGDAGLLALAFEVFEQMGPLGFVEVLGGGFHQAVESFQGGGQFPETGTLAGS